VTTVFPTLSDIVAEHYRGDEWGGPDWECGADNCFGGGNSYEDYAQHIQDEWLKARTITTAEQLDQLPFLTLIREQFRPAPSGADYGGVYERRTTGWTALAGVFIDAADNGEPRLPVQVIYHPDTDRLARIDGT